MKKYLSLIILALALLSQTAFAQSIKGRIVDQTGQPVPGAMILNKSNEKWSNTDLDGKFTLEVSKGQTLQISCLGFAAQEFAYDGTTLEFKLMEETLELEEAVAIGYGTVRKKDLSGAVGVMAGNVLQQQSVTNVSQGLQGVIPGLMVTRSSSMPGASATLRIRGVTTMSNNSPLILVDGMAVSSLDDVSPEDIDQISVLKDGASASIYGARAAAGVILVTTKQAHEGDVTLNYKGEFSMVTATEWAEYLTDPVEYMTMYNEYRWNETGNVPGSEYLQYSKESIDNYRTNNAYDPIEYPDFDWKGNTLKDMSFRHKHNLSVAYGNKIIKTRVSASYEYDDALYPGSNYQRATARTRNTIKIAKNWSADVDLSFKHGIKNDPLTNPIQAALMYPSNYLGLYPDGRVAPGKSGSNTLATVLYGGSKNNITDYVTGKVSVSWKPFKGFDVTGAFTPTFSFTKTKTMSKAVPYYDAYDTSLILGYVSGHTTNDLTEVRNDAQSYETQLVVTYEHSFNNSHNLNVMAGYEGYSYNHESFSTSTTNMQFAEYPYMDLANKDNVTTSGSAYGNAYQSFFGRIMYNYKNKYYVQANVRGDGSSRFAKQYRWGCFPSGSLAWVVSSEPWMANATAITFLKLRASAGALGNERISDNYYPYQAEMNSTQSVMFNAEANAATSQLAMAQVEYAVTDITWETTYTYDVGLDMSFFNGRLGFTGDYYYKQTKDMLLDVQIPEFMGYSNPSQNAGTMYTNGWELKLDWKDVVGDFSYSLGFNISDYKSIMGNLNGTYKLSDGKIIIEGAEYNSWYGYKSLGILRTDEEVAAAGTQLIPNVTKGDIGYQDLNNDGKISADDDRTVLGSSMPHILYGGYVNLAWKGISLNVMFNGVGKQLALVTSNERLVRPFSSQWLAAPAVIKGNYYSEYNTDEQNALVKYPRMTYTTAEKNNYQVSDYWLFDGSYFRIKSINLGYTFPAKWMKPANIKELRVFFNTEDPFCFDNYLQGWDPEQTASSYITRTFTFGIDIKF